MAPRASIQDLSNELLREILDYIEADPNKLVSLDRRGYLSQESFAPPPPPSTDQVEDIGSIRLVCHRFSQLGAVHQFSRISTRFSRSGLERLENIAREPHLAKHVRKFSYMVPNFYVEGRARVRDILPRLEQNLGALDARNFDRKASEQRKIVQTQKDLKVLRIAAKAFTHLQHVQILRLQDEEDAVLLRYLIQHAEFAQFVQLKWEPACVHSALTLARALIEGQSPCSRFSTPMASPPSVQAFAIKQPNYFHFARNLTSLELHFDGGNDLDGKMREMSPLFKEMFEAAVNMQSIHIGFPSHRPISLRLEEIFHGVKWEKLSAFGIQAWKLDENEILDLADRYRERLRGLRLRDVLLNEGSAWKNVLGFLRHEMKYLEWVSLRRIGYTKKFDEQWMGAEIPDDPPGGVSDSDEEGEESDRESQHSTGGFDQSNTNQADPSSSDDDDGEDDDGNDDDDDDDSIQLSDTGNDEEEQDHEMDFPRIRADTPDSSPWCSCSGRRSSQDAIERLGDNGVSVTNEQRRRWEQWVTRRCIEHQ